MNKYDFESSKAPSAASFYFSLFTPFIRISHIAVCSQRLNFFLEFCYNGMDSRSTSKSGRNLISCHKNEETSSSTVICWSSYRKTENYEIVCLFRIRFSHEWTRCLLGKKGAKETRRDIVLFLLDWINAALDYALGEKEMSCLNIQR
jgi:hypothetical protein